MQKDQGYTNAERIMHELSDLATVVGMLQDDGMLPIDTEDFRGRTEAKRLKLAWYMEYSRQKGCLA